jgi:ABC-type transport system involved in multi-copper enzyme maturation permease subunit
MSQATAVASYSQAEPRGGSAWTQTGALLLDAYRDLQSRKLFWFTLVLSTFVPLIFAAVGIDPNGITIFGQHLRGVPFNSGLIPPGEFFKLMFTSLAIPLWLGFIATILGLMAVGGIFPDVIGNGSIDLYLSRPISRLRLFLTKYLFGLLFTALQVLCFCAVSFGVIGIRGGVWEPRIFLAVPLVTIYFSYLYCVCVLVGIVTRSALAAILMTVIVWGIIYTIHNGNIVLSQFTASADVRVEDTNRLIAANNELIARNQALPPERRSNLSGIEYQRNYQRELLADYESTAASLHWWRNLVKRVETPLPKTSETVAAMSKWLVRPGTFTAIDEQHDRRRPPRPDPSRQRERLGQFMNSPEVEQRMDEELRARDLPWVLGTSLGFEAVILTLAAWVFCRKDF